MHRFCRREQGRDPHRSSSRRRSPFRASTVWNYQDNLALRERTLRTPFRPSAALVGGPALTIGTDPRVLTQTLVRRGIGCLAAVSLRTTFGLEALAHFIDSLWAPRADPIVTTAAAEVIRLLGCGLPLVFDSPDDLCAREQTQYGRYDYMRP